MFRYIIYFVFFFFLFYSEGIDIGGMTVSQLWKMPLIVYMVFFIAISRRKHRRPSFIRLYYGISIKNLINSGIATNFISNVQEGLRYIFVPLIYDSFFLSKKDINGLYDILLRIAQYFVLTNIPFLFFGLKSLSEGMEYGDFMAYTGIFQNQHAMSVIMAICILTILHSFKRYGFSLFRIGTLYNVALLVMAFYSMFLGFARTGWLMCIFGIIILFLPQKISIKQLAVMGFFICALAGGIIYMMNNNELFHDRVLGIDVETGKQLDVGSGRGDYMTHAIEYYKEGNFMEWIFGRSMKGLKDYEYIKTGMNITSHNGFVNMLVVNGIVGIILMIWCLIAMLLWIRKRKYCSGNRLALAVWFMNLSFQLTQGGHFFHADLFYALIFVILERENTQRLLKA